MAIMEGLRFCEPMLAKLVGKLPEGAEWQYEVKWDGYRVQVLKEGERVRVLSRRGNDFTKRFAEVAKAAAGLRADVVVLDGEVVAVDAEGRPSFQALQHRSKMAGYQVVFYAFDLLNLEGEDFGRRTLGERQGALSKVVKGTNVRFGEGEFSANAFFIPGQRAKMFDWLRLICGTN
jgi:bifunctional non-homologous end joining protein LigD